jgi:fused signal recognition particle receptor
LEELLLEADTGVETTTSLIDELRDLGAGPNKITPEDVRSHLINRLTTLFDDDASEQHARFTTRPWVILLVGVNGSGKTTTAGKLAHQFAIQGKKSVIAAADTFRAAAVEQLEEWSRRSGARFVRQEGGADPASVAFDAYQSAVARGEDVLIVDTAGRLQAKKNLMDELAKVKRVLGRFDPTAPHEVLLVIDATTGQNGLSQARGFDSAAGVTGLVITKLDGTARGGIVIPIRKELGLPVKFISLGEKIDDLLPFSSEAYIEALLAS